MKYTVKTDRTHTIDIKSETAVSDSFKVSIEEEVFDVQIKEFHPNGQIKTILVNNRIIPVHIDKYADGIPRAVYLNGLPVNVDIEKIKTSLHAENQTEKEISGEVNSSLPGQIVALLVEENDQVEKGQPLLILESMKMENEIHAPKQGKVVEINISAGQMVMKEDLLLKIE